MNLNMKLNNWKPRPIRNIYECPQCRKQFSGYDQILINFDSNKPGIKCCPYDETPLKTIKEV